MSIVERRASHRQDIFKVRSCGKEQSLRLIEGEAGTTGKSKVVGCIRRVSLVAMEGWKFMVLS